MPKQTALDTINRLIAEENSSGATRQRTGDAVRTIDQLLAEEEERERRQEEEQQRRKQATRNASSAGEVMDLVRSYGDYGLERRAAETPQPVKEERRVVSNALTPEMEARRQAAAGVNRAPNAYQTAMMQAMNAQPRQYQPEESRTDRQLLSDAVRQGILARGTDRMATDLVFGKQGEGPTPSEQMLGISNQGIQNRLYDPTYTTRLSASGQQMEAQREKADKAQNLYDTVTTQRQAQREFEKYSPLLSNPDFVEKSQGDARIADKGPVSSMSDAERLYKNIFHRNDTYKDNNALSVSPAQYVTDEEAAIFFYLWNTQGAKAAKAYYDGYVENRASERKAGAVQTQAYNYGQYDPIGASIASVGTNLASGVGLLDIAFQNLTRLAGITSASKPINYNSGFQMPGIATDSLRQGASDYLVQAVTDEIKRANPNAKNPEKYAQVANFLYQTGMSMADSSVAIALNLMGIPEPLTLAAMGSAAGTRAIQDARERGATDGQALAFGISSAIMEALFEKISLDKILEPSYAQTAKAHFLNALKQSFTEGSEEVMTTLANTAMDQLIMGDKSELFTRQRQLMEQGVSEKEALGAAFKQLGTEIVGDLLGGMISGFGMGGVKEAGTGLGVFAQGVRQDMQTARALTDYQNAQQAAPQIAPQQTPAAPVQQRQLTEREQNPLQFALTKAQNGETVTGQDAKAIIADPKAVQTLRDAGVLADTIRPGAEGRAQIQQAVQALAEQNRAEMPETQQTTERTSQLPVQNQQETAQERTTPPLPRQMAQEQQERVTTPPVPQNTQEAAQEPTLRLHAQEEQAPRQETLRLPKNEVAEPTQQEPLTIRGANATVEENRQEENYGQGQQTETAATAGEDDFRARAETAAEGARRSYLDRIERSSGLGRVLQDLRNYRIVRGAESRASEVSRIRNQAEAGNQRDVSALDYGVANGSAEQSAKELDNATASRVLGRNWDRAVAELARQGWTLKGMTGQLWKQDGPPVRAFINGDTKTIVVQVDHTKLSWDQLLAHEDLHRRIKENPAYRKAVEDALLADKKLQAYLPEIIDRYAQAYAEHAPDLTSDDVIEELLADYRAGFDMLDPLGMNPITARAAKRAAKDIKGVEKERYGFTGRPMQEDVVKVGVALDSKTESANPGNFSIETWNASDYVQNSAAAAADLAEQLGVSNRQAKKYINDINSIAKIIANDRVRLDYTPSPNRSSFIGNTEYGGSIDFSTICKKRRLYTGTIEAIQKALPNTAITADELLNIRAMMKDRGYEVSCGLCYVEGSRVKIGEYTQQFLNELKGTGMYVPTMAEMNTSDGQEQIRAEHPEVYEQYVKFMNKLAQRKPKLFQMATEYQGEILKKFKNDGTVDQKNRNGGLRLQSFSDFEIIHLIDTMQVIMDMSRVGLAGQAYTKVPDFAWALGDTGLKINLSLIAKGVDENGHIILDEVEGMKRADAEALRNAYSKNVGTILVTFNDEQLKAAMADPFIDFIIPFHRSQWSKAQYDAIGLPKGTKDYTDQQNESYTEKVYNANGKPQRPANYMPNNYWDFNKSGKENAEAYLRMCAENNRTPKFYKLLADNGDGSFSLQKDGSTDGYWKLLSDFKMYDNAGKGSPQLPVKPKFNMAQAERMLNEYTGGHQKFPVAQDVVDDFLKGKQEGKASTEIDTDYLAAVNSGDTKTAQRMVDEAAKKAGYTIRAYHGTRSFGFTEFDPTRSDDGISLFATSDPQTAESYSGRTKRTRITDRTTKKAEDLSGKELLAEAQKISRLYDRYKLMNNSDRERLRTETKSAISWSIKRAQEYVRDHRDALDADKSAIMDRLISALYHLRDSETENEVDDAWTEWEDAIWDLKGIDDDIAMEFLDDVDSRGLFINKNDLQDLTYQGDMYINWALGEHVFDQQLQIEVNADYHKGIYELYGKPGKQLAVYANGENWNAITPPKELTDYGLDGPQRTRDIASAAKALGYDSVVFYGLRDNGGETAYNGKSNVYIFFDANQLKSADPVTYDDKGKPISLSERFNPKNDDIRFSREVTDEDMLRRLNKAEQEGIRNFSEITEGDKKGVVKVYRAMQAQPVDESGNVIPNASVRRIVSYDPLIVEAKVFTKNGRKKTSEIITAPAKLFSPMAGQNNGVWRNPIELNKWEMSEGHPERATTQIDEKTGKPKIDNDKKNASYGEVAYWYGLDKGGVDDDGNPLTPVPARYNPYSHTSLSALNDQFSSAEKRPELVTVESLVPVWHINNGAENERLPLAKDRVGAMSWHSGPTSSRLAKIGKPRTVILTRYDKPIRVVPDTEVAKSIADTIGDSKNVAIPASTVTPALAKELKALGVNVLNAEEWKQYNQQFPTKTFGRTSIEIDPEVAAQFSPEAIARRQSNRTKGVKGERKVSRVRSNTYEYSGLYNEVEAQMDEADEENYTYDPVSEKKSMNEALGRLKADFDGEVSRLSEADRQWGGSDLDTAMGILHRYRTEGRATGDYGDFWRWSKVIQEKGTKGGQFIQAFAKYTRTGTGAAMKGAKDIHDRFKLNPAQQKQVDAAKKKLMDGIDGDMNGAAQDAMKQAKGQKGGSTSGTVDNSEELKAARRRVEHLESRVRKLKDELAKLKGENRRLGKTNDRLEAKEAELKKAESDLEKARRRIDQLSKKNAKETQRRKDAERLVREISKLFEKQQNHGEPVENWLNLTGEELARKIAGRFSEPKQRTKTTMQTILSDLVGFAEEHALPDRKKAEGTKRTAIDTITDYLNNRDAYGTAWAAAQSYLRAAYTDDQEKLDALNSFLTATIAYNAEGTDRTMLDAILQSADVLGISEKRILELTSAGATASTIDRIGDELVNQVKERMGADYDESFTQQLKDAVRRHITGIALQESTEEQRLRLGGMTTDAARQLELNLQKLLTQSRGDKNKAARSVADYLIRELGIPSSDAAIAAERITGAFMDELASRADRKLQQMFAEKKPKTQEQRDRLLDLIRLGGLTNSNVEDAVVDALGIGGMSRERQRELVGVMAQFGETLDAMEADDLDGLRDLIRAQAAVRNTPLSRQAEKALAGETDAQYLREFALAQLDAIAGDFAEMSPGAKISTFQTISHLLNMRTALRNLTSNQVFDLVDSAANNLATIPDMVIGAFTGKRTVGVNKSWLSEMKRAGAKQGAARNALEVRLDVSPDDRQKSKYGTAGRRTNSMAASNAFGRILSHLEEVMGYELNTTDEFHKGSVRGETLESLARFVERGDITQEQANAWAEEEALYRSFQDDTLVGNIMGELKTLLNVIGFGDSGKTNSRGRTIHDFGLGDLVVKYTQVPGALIHRGIEYSPLGYAKMLYDLAIAKDSLVRTQKRGEDVTNAQRKLALDIGRATTGSGLITLFAVLAKAGLLRRDDDDKDKNAKAMHAAQGLSGTQLNLTALKRWIEGGDLSLTDGDVLADIGFLEPLDSLMTIATLMANDDDLSISDVGVKSLDGVWKALSNTSAMQTISNIISTVQYHDEENDLPLYFQIPIEIASDSISGFVPSPVRQLAQATDTTYRDQYRSKDLNKQIQARVMNSIPGVRQMLAPKITPLGEDRKYQKPLLNYLNATLNPGNINVYQGSGVVDELNRVYDETDDAKIWPERNAPYSFTANDEKWTLTPDERTQYQRTRGQTTANAMDAVMGTDWYKSMGATDQAEVLNWIGNFSNFVAKKEMLESRGQEYGSTTYNKYYEAWQSGTPIEDVVADKYGKLIKVAEETAAAETIIAEAKIPEASKEEAETMSADAKRYYAGFLKGGVSDETARKLATELDGSEASGHEQWRMVYDAAGKEGEKAVTSVMTDDMKRNWNLAKDAGVSMDDYIKVREGFKDLNGNGNKSQDEWNATLDSFTFSTNAAKDKSIKGTLWQILTGSGSTKNNPYDREAGQKVIDAKSGGGSGSGSYAPARIPTLRLPEVPRAEKPSSGLRIRSTQPSETRQGSGLRLPSYTAAPRQSSGLKLK